MNFQKTRENVNQFLGSQQYVLLPLLFVITLILTIVLYPDLLLTDKAYTKGDIVDVDIKAPADFYIKDIPATETNRKAASASILTVYDYDADLVHHLVNKINDAFKIPRDIIEKHHEAVRVEKHHEAVRVQNELKKKAEEEKLQTENSMQTSAAPLNPDKTPEVTPPEIKIEPLPEKLQKVKDAFKDKIGLLISDESYAYLKRNEFSL